MDSDEKVARKKRILRQIHKECKAFPLVTPVKIQDSVPNSATKSLVNEPLGGSMKDTPEPGEVLDKMSEVDQRDDLTTNMGSKPGNPKDKGPPNTPKEGESSKKGSMRSGTTRENEVTEVPISKTRTEKQKDSEKSDSESDSEESDSDCTSSSNPNPSYISGIRLDLYKIIRDGGVGDPTPYVDLLFPLELNEDDPLLFSEVHRSFTKQSFLDLVSVFYDQHFHKMADMAKEKIYARLKYESFDPSDDWRKNVLFLQSALARPIRELSGNIRRFRNTFQRQKHLDEFNPRSFFCKGFVKEKAWLLDWYPPVVASPGSESLRDFNDSDPLLREFDFETMDLQFRRRFSKKEFSNLLLFVRNINLQVRSSENKPHLWNKLPHFLGRTLQIGIYLELTSLRRTVTACTVARLWVTHLNFVFGFYRDWVLSTHHKAYVYYRVGGRQSELEFVFQNERMREFYKGNPKYVSDVLVDEPTQFPEEHADEIFRYEMGLEYHKFSQEKETNYLLENRVDEEAIHLANESSPENDDPESVAFFGVIRDKMSLRIAIPEETEDEDIFKGHSDGRSSSPTLGGRLESPSNSPTPRSGIDTVYSCDSSHRETTPIINVPGPNGPPVRGLSNFLETTPEEPVFNSLSLDSLKKVEASLLKWEARGLEFNRNLIPENIQLALNLQMRVEMIQKTLSFIPADLWPSIKHDSWKDPKLFPTKAWIEWMFSFAKKGTPRPDSEIDDVLEKFAHYLETEKWLIDVNEFSQFLNTKYAFIVKEYLNKVEEKFQTMHKAEVQRHMNRFVRLFTKAFRPKHSGYVEGNEHLVRVARRVIEDVSNATKEDEILSFHEIFARLLEKALAVMKEANNAALFHFIPSLKRKKDEDDSGTGGDPKSRKTQGHGSASSHSSGKFHSSASSSSSFSSTSGPHSNSSFAKPRREDKSHSKRQVCDNCGQSGHLRDKCVFKGHPECNAAAYDKPAVAWADSKAYRAVKDKYSSEFFKSSLLSGEDKNKYSLPKTNSSGRMKEKTPNNRGGK